MAIPGLQIPQMGAVSGGLDFTPLANLGQVYQQASDAARKKLLISQIGQGGKVDTGALIGSGDLDLMKLGIAQQNKEEDRKVEDEKPGRGLINAGGGKIYDSRNRKWLTADSADPAAEATLPAGAAPVQGEGLPVPKGGMSDEALRNMVKAYRKGMTGVLTGIGRGTQGPKNLERFWNLMAEDLAADGQDGADLAAAKANYGAQSAAASQSAKREASVDASINEAKNTFPLLVDASKNLPRYDNALANKGLYWWREITNDPRQSSFNAAVQGSITAYSQAMSRTGANSVFAQQHAEDLFKRNGASHDAIVATTKQLEKEMAAAKAAPAETKQKILQDILLGKWKEGDQPKPTSGEDHPPKSGGVGGTTKSGISWSVE